MNDPASLVLGLTLLTTNVGLAVHNLLLAAQFVS